jgi:ubiquitin thioesterase OTU1
VTRMRFKIENTDGSTNVVSSDSLTSESTIQDLLLIIISPGTSDIQYSYPRKKLDVANLLATLGELGIKSGEKFTLSAGTGTEGEALNNDARSSSSTKVNKRMSTGEFKSPPISTAPVAAPLKKKTKESTIPFEGFLTPPSNHPGSFLRVVPIPDDNSCLFASISYVTNRRSNTDMRALIVDKVQAGYYDEVMLGESIEAYVGRIKGKNAWGGALDVQIFATEARTEIWSFDVQSLAPPIRFGILF